MAQRTKDIFTREWIIENAVDVLSRYEDGVLTIRGLHYQLVSRGMTNDIQHYKRVVAATGQARWDGIISFNAFSDRDRALACSTVAEPVILEESEDAYLDKFVPDTNDDYFDQSYWAIDIDSLDALLALSEKEGEIIVSAPCEYTDNLPEIEIYDDYRE